jgi:chromosome segregation ATPase
MSRLADQIEEMEENLACAESRVNELEDENTRLKDEISELEDRVTVLEEQLDWIHTTYPDLEVAFEVKRRLDDANV